MFGSNWRKFYSDNPLTTLAVLGVVAVLAVGFFTQPEELKPVIAPHNNSESDGDSKGSRSVTCNANCQVHFGAGSFRGARDNDADSVDDNANRNHYSAESISLADFSQQQRMAHWSVVIAVLSAFGAVLLIGTLKATAAATDAAVDTAKETNKQFKLMSAPHLRAGDAFFEDITDPNNILRPRVPRPGSNLRYQIMVVNKGIQKATLDAVLFEAYWAEKPLDMHYIPQRNLQGRGKTVLRTNDGDQKGIVLKELESGGWGYLRLEETVPADVENKILYYIGYVAYFDELDRRETLKFCRRYDESAGLFTRIENLDFDNQR